MQHAFNLPEFYVEKVGDVTLSSGKIFPKLPYGPENLLAIGKADEKPRNLNMMGSQNNIRQLVAAYPDLRIRDSRLSAVCFEAERWPG